MAWPAPGGGARSGNLIVSGQPAFVQHPARSAIQPAEPGFILNEVPESAGPR